MNLKKLCLTVALAIPLFSTLASAECDRSRFGKKELQAQLIVDEAESPFLNDEGMISRLNDLQELEKNATCELIEYKTNLRTPKINFVDVCVKIRFRCLSVGDRCFNETTIACKDQSEVRNYQINTFWNRKTNEISYVSEKAVLKQN
jgi:hypothetical protein